MESKSKKDLMFRLLQLEQQFESYCALYEEELAEINDSLRQLREDILRLGRDLEPEPNEDILGASADGKVLRRDASDSGSLSNDLSV
jgi:hypothetical protein